MNAKIGRKEAKAAAQAKWGERAGVWMVKNYGFERERGVYASRFFAAPVVEKGARMTHSGMSGEVSAESWEALIAALANASAPAGPGVGSVASANPSSAEPAKGGR